MQLAYTTLVHIQILSLDGSTRAFVRRIDSCAGMLARSTGEHGTMFFLLNCDLSKCMPFDGSPRNFELSIGRTDEGPWANELDF